MGVRERVREEGRGGKGERRGEGRGEETGGDGNEGRGL